MFLDISLSLMQFPHSSVEQSYTTANFLNSLLFPYLLVLNTVFHLSRGYLLPLLNLCVACFCYFVLRPSYDPFLLSWSEPESHLLIRGQTPTENHDTSTSKQQKIRTFDYIKTVIFNHYMKEKVSFSVSLLS